MGIAYHDVMERMMRAGELRNASRVARALNVTPQAISNYKKRGELPADLVIRFADIYGLSMDWLITGRGGVKPVEEGSGGAGKVGSAFARTDRAEKEACGAEMVVGFVAMSPDEMIYVGRFLKVLRKSCGAVPVVKNNLDSLLNAIEGSG